MLGAVVLLIALVALAAAIVPVRRASIVNPTMVLLAEWSMPTESGIHGVLTAGRTARQSKGVYPFSVSSLHAIHSSLSASQRRMGRAGAPTAMQ